MPEPLTDRELLIAKLTFLATFESTAIMSRAGFLQTEEARERITLDPDLENKLREATPILLERWEAQKQEHETGAHT